MKKFHNKKKKTKLKKKKKQETVEKRSVKKRKIAKKARKSGRNYGIFAGEDSMHVTWTLFPPLKYPSSIPITLRPYPPSSSSSATATATSSGKNSETVVPPIGIVYPNFYFSIFS